MNRALNYLEKSKRVHLSEDPQAQEPLVVNDIDQTLDLERALTSLNPKLRQLLFLKYKNDLSQQQIAQDFLERDLDTEVEDH